MIVAKLGGEAQFQAALKTGDVFEVEENGKVFYAFQTVSTSVATSSKQKVGTKQAEVQLTDEHSAGFEAFFGSFDPSLRVNSSFSNPKTKNNSPTEWAPEALEKVDEALNLAGQAKRVGAPGRPARAR